MAQLDSESINEVWRDIQQDFSAERKVIPILKEDLKAAIVALDTFLSNNASTINSAIPQPARSGLTTTQKAKLLSYVIYKRYIKEV